MKRIMIIMTAVLLTLCFTACSQSGADNDDIYGTWQYYGMIPYDSNYQGNLNEEDIITGEEFEDTFGAEVPDQTITITEDGVKEYQDIKGTRVISWEKDEQANGQWFMTAEITEINGEEPLDTPLQEKSMFTLRDGYLFVESHVDSDEYDDSDYAVVYVRAK